MYGVSRSPPFVTSRTNTIKCETKFRPTATAYKLKSKRLLQQTPRRPRKLVNRIPAPMASNTSNTTSSEPMPTRSCTVSSFTILFMSKVPQRITPASAIIAEPISKKIRLSVPNTNWTSPLHKLMHIFSFFC